jgi:hypothetical protein
MLLLPEGQMGGDWNPSKKSIPIYEIGKRSIGHYFLENRDCR